MEKEKSKHKLDLEEYENELLNLSRRQLMNECVRLKKRLNAFSDICDIEDTYEIINENFRLNTKIKTTERLRKILNQLIVIISRELRVQGRARCIQYGDLADNLLFLIENLKKQQNNAAPDSTTSPEGTGEEQ